MVATATAAGVQQPRRLQSARRCHRLPSTPPLAVRQKARPAPAAQPCRVRCRNHHLATQHVPARTRRRCSIAPAVAAAAAAGDAAADDELSHPIPGASAAGQPAARHVQHVLLLACVAMAAAALHRVAFSILAPPIQAELGLSLPQMGCAHSALLIGYVLGQVSTEGITWSGVL